MNRSRLVPVLVVAVLVVGAVTVAVAPSILPDDGDDTPYADESVEVEGGTLDADTTQLWSDTQEAMGYDVNATPTVVLERWDGSREWRPSAGDRFWQLLIPDDGGGPASAFADADEVHVQRDWVERARNGETDRSFAELLVHEYAHVVQYYAPAFDEDAIRIRGVTNDETRGSQAILEGGAEFVADDHVDASVLERYHRMWRSDDTSARDRLSYWPYYRGLVYLEDRLEDPEELLEFSEEPPESTVTILRGEPPGDGPPNRSLVVSVDDHHVAYEDRLGAYFVESMLTVAVEPERARDVAAGWQWDSIHSIQPDGDADVERTSRHLWVTEWRNESAADAFERAMTEYLDHRWSRDDGIWWTPYGTDVSLQRLDDRDVALLLAPESFHANVTISTNGDEYRIESASEASSNVTASTAGSPPNAGDFAPSDAASATSARLGA